MQRYIAYLERIFSVYFTTYQRTTDVLRKQNGYFFLPLLYIVVYRVAGNFRGQADLNE